MSQFQAPIQLKSELAELLRPWKILTLCLGVGLLIAGAMADIAPDWDIPISFIMAILAYILAPFSMRVILERRWAYIPLSLLFAWITVDGSYWLYWHFKNPHALEAMRKANFLASLGLYGMCGMLWLYRGSVSEFIRELRNLFNKSK